MTLITYPTRIHFAHDILEEALHSECDSARLRHPLLLGGADDARQTHELWERVRAGLPHGAHPISYALPADFDMVQAVGHVRGLTDGKKIDLIIAFGDPETIVLGRKCRKMLSGQGGIDGSLRRPALYVVQGLDGLPDPCARHTGSWQNGLPDVIICDPSVLRDAMPDRSLHAAIISLVRGVESYLAKAYNPTADGMALDAFNRSVATLPRLTGRADDATARELMAAALNAALSQQKGLGPTQRLTAMLRAQCGGLDAAAVARLILPGTVEAMGAAQVRVDLLGRMLGRGNGGGDGGARLRSFLADVPHSAASLSDMGVTQRDIDAVVAVADRAAMLPGGARAVLDAVY